MKQREEFGGSQLPGLSNGRIGELFTEVGRERAKGVESCFRSTGFEVSQEIGLPSWHGAELGFDPGMCALKDAHLGSMCSFQEGY